MPPRPALDAETILSATEGVLRRHGPAKTSVVDVARALGVSHAAVYRHFPSKTALREAVARRWINQGQETLVRIAGDSGVPAAERLPTWFRALLATKQARITQDPEMFATFRLLVLEHSAVAAEHVASLLGQLRTIVQDGITAGEFAAGDAGAIAKALFDATLAFHHPALADEWVREGTAARQDAVCAQLLNGLLR